MISGGVVLVLLLTGCGDSGAPEDEGTSTPDPTGTTVGEQTDDLPDNVTDDGDSIVITVTDLSFPESVTVPADRSVEWENQSGANHVIVFETGPKEVPSVELGRGTTAGLPLPAGEWTYFCSIHPQMTGSLSVS
jgi:plastocyanin